MPAQTACHSEPAQRRRRGSHGTRVNGGVIAWWPHGVRRGGQVRWTQRRLDHTEGVGSDGGTNITCIPATAVGSREQFGAPFKPSLRPHPPRTPVFPNRTQTPCQNPHLAGRLQRAHGYPPLLSRADEIAAEHEADCPGRKPPFWAVKHPARPYKSDSLWETPRPLKRPGRARTVGRHRELVLQHFRAHLQPAHRSRCRRRRSPHAMFRGRI
jgi:hypothetical protein